MVENFSKEWEKFSTILFFCKKTGNTFDCFFKNGHGSIKLSKERTNSWEHFFGNEGMEEMI